MEARVKSTYRWNTVTAFSGVEFVKSEYRKVPVGFEEQAKAHPCLETRKDEPASKTPALTDEEKAAKEAEKKAIADAKKAEAEAKKAAKEAEKQAKAS